MTQESREIPGFLLPSLLPSCPEAFPVGVGEAGDFGIAPALCSEGVGEDGEIGGGIDPFGEPVGAEAAVHVGAQGDVIAGVGQLTDMLDVADAVGDLGAFAFFHVWGDEIAEEIEPDDSPTTRDLDDGFVGKMALVFFGIWIAHQGSAVGMRRHHRTISEGEEFVG